jgi:hypothetical protein
MMRSSGSSLADSGPRESLSLRLRRFAQGDLEAVLGPARGEHQRHICSKSLIGLPEADLGEPRGGHPDVIGSALGHF